MIKSIFLNENRFKDFEEFFIEVMKDREISNLSKNVAAYSFVIYQENKNKIGSTIKVKFEICYYLNIDLEQYNDCMEELIRNRYLLMEVI